MTICGKDNLKKFQKWIGFLHPEKKQRLQDAINSYQDHNWKIPINNDEFLGFLKLKGKHYKTRKEIRFNSVKKENLLELGKALNRFKIKSKLFGPWQSGSGSKYYCLTINKEALNERSKARTSSGD